MKRIIILLILVVSTIFTYAQCIGEGYLLTIENSKSKPIITKSIDKDFVSSMINKYTGQDIKLDKIFVNNNYFDLKTNNFYVYCEKKAVYKIKGKIVYKTINKERKREIQTLKLK